MCCVAQNTPCRQVKATCHENPAFFHVISLACLADSGFRDVSRLVVSTSVLLAHHLARFVELVVIR